MLEVTTVEDDNMELTEAGTVPSNDGLLVSNLSGGAVPCDDCYKLGGGAPEVSEALIDGACLDTKGLLSVLKLD